jgi:hypothetical protein
MANDRVEKQIDSLKALRGGGLTAETTAALKKALTDRVNLIVAKAAQICGEMQASALIPEMKEAFERLFQEGKDQQCWGKNALAKSLKDLGVQESAVFLPGCRHVQMEAVWGGQQDTAEVLRGTCMMALVQCADIPRDEILRHLVEALSEGSATVRLDATRALEQMGGREVILLLRLKARLAEKDSRITGQVLEALLQLEGREAIAFVGKFLEHGDEELRDEGALALGASRMPEAVAFLRAAWEQRRGKRPGAILLRAISASRSDEALQFLLALVANGRQHDADDALYALELHKGTEEMFKRVEHTVRERADNQLTELFRKRFVLD